MFKLNFSPIVILRKKISQINTVKKRVWLFRLLRFSVALTIAFFICQVPLPFIEFYSYDLRVRYRPTSPPSGWIKTVAVDRQTVELLNRDPNVKDHTQLLSALVKARPYAVVYLIQPNELVGSYDDLLAFVSTSKKLNLFYVVFQDLIISGQESKLELPPPLDSLTLVPGPRTWDKSIFGKDGVSRRLIFSFRDRLTLHPLLASKITRRPLSEFNGVFPFLDSTQAYIDFRPSGTYAPMSFVELIENKTDLSQFKDKVVVVGRDIGTVAVDYVMTPHSRDIVAMTNLELHANMLDTMIQNRAPFLAPTWLNYLLTALISILTVYVVLTVRPMRGILILAGTLFSFILVSYLIFLIFNFWTPMAHPPVAIFVCYYFFIPYRLIMENRRSWEYYQKNKILTQVEELKSNFLRLMSHDLRTPLARMQGMVEILARSEDSLDPSQKKALKILGDSTEELVKFVSSVLDLSRIESKEIKLQLKSRDINTLLKEVIQQFQLSAKEKEIELITEFDPLFSIRIDEELLKQVFANLIENAIKYSGSKSRVLISTEEKDQRIIIQVADQGVGIPDEEIERVFDKFYRSTQATNSQEKGTGLGLYLAKYFVELHGGRISVESSVNLGSTFTVELPMETA